MSKKEQEPLHQHLLPPFISPSLMSEIIPLIEKRYSLKAVMKMLKHQPDPQHQITNIFPPYFTSEDIVAGYRYLESLWQSKLRALQQHSHNGQVLVFHGTTTDRLPSIRSQGLLPNQPTKGFSNAFSDRKRDFVFFFINVQEAIAQAQYHANIRNSKPTVIETTLPLQLLIPDLDNRNPNDSFKFPATNNLSYLQPHNLGFIQGVRLQLLKIAFRI